MRRMMAFAKRMLGSLRGHKTQLALAVRLAVAASRPMRSMRSWLKNGSFSNTKVGAPGGPDGMGLLTVGNDPARSDRDRRDRRVHRSIIAAPALTVLFYRNIPPVERRCRFAASSPAPWIPPLTRRIP
jgi:hypothetical protein